MKLFAFLYIFFAVAGASAVLCQDLAGDGDRILEPPAVKKDLYPANADAKKEIGEAIKHAAREHRRVLLVFGGNWCYDCHVLDHALHEGVAGQVLKESFVLVHVDIGEADKNLDLVQKYQIPLDKGVPALAVLDGDGQLLYRSSNGEFEAARTMMKKELVAFLRRWKESIQPIEKQR